MDNFGTEVFLAIVSTGSFRSAAQLLNLTQSSVSYHLSELENKLGAPLLERHRGNKEIKVTPLGEEFLEFASKWQGLEEEFQLLTQRGRRQVIRIGGLNSVKDFILPPILKRVREQFHDRQIQIMTGNSSELYDLILQQHMDIAFVQFVMQKKGILSIPFSWEELFLVQYRPDPLLPEGDVRELDIRKQRFINWGYNFLKWQDRMIGPVSDTGVWCDTLNDAVQMMYEAGDWVIIPASAVGLFRGREGFAVQKIRPEAPRRMVSVIFRSGQKRINQKLLSVMAGTGQVDSGQNQVHFIMHQYLHRDSGL